MIATVISTYFIVCNFECDTASVLLTCVELFLLEWILFSISQLISKNALIVLIYSITRNVVIKSNNCIAYLHNIIFYLGIYIGCSIKGG